MRRPIQSTELLETPMSFRLSNTPSTSRSVRSLRTEATRVGSTSARPWATSSSGSNPSVPFCGKSTSVLLPSGGLTKNSSSFSTPTATQDVTQSVNHQLAPLCQPSGALFRGGWTARKRKRKLLVNCSSSHEPGSPACVSRSEPEQGASSWKRWSKLSQPRKTSCVRI